LFTECDPAPVFTDLHRVGRSARPKLVPSKGTKEMLHREHGPTCSRGSARAFRSTASSQTRTALRNSPPPQRDPGEVVVRPQWKRWEISGHLSVIPERCSSDSSACAGDDGRKHWAISGMLSQIGESISSDRICARRRAKPLPLVVVAMLSASPGADRSQRLCRRGVASNKGDVGGSRPTSRASHHHDR
jgi:hypothetical protein